MGSRRDSRHHQKKKSRQQQSREKDVGRPGPERKKLEIVLKCDTSGCGEAIISAIDSINLPEVDIQIISSGVGSVSKSDIFMAETGSRLIVGFNVGLMPAMEQMAVDHSVEIRLYDVIYRLIGDVESIGRSLVPRESTEEIIGTAKVIALFKSSRRGIILGCEVQAGRLATGDSFRVLGPMGTLYTGTIESLHIEKDAVREASRGKQVGLKIRDFNKARVGYLVESYKPGREAGDKPWQPKGKVIYPK